MNPNGVFTRQSSKDIGNSNGNTDQLTGPVPVPEAVPGAVPQPSPMVLMGAGVIGLAGAHRKFPTSI